MFVDEANGCLTGDLLTRLTLRLTIDGDATWCWSYRETEGSVDDCNQQDTGRV